MRRACGTAQEALRFSVWQKCTVHFWGLNCAKSAGIKRLVAEFAAKGVHFYQINVPSNFSSPVMQAAKETHTRFGWWPSLARPQSSPSNNDPLPPPSRKSISTRIYASSAGAPAPSPSVPAPMSSSLCSSSVSAAFFFFFFFFFFPPRCRFGGNTGQAQSPPWLG